MDAAQLWATWAGTALAARMRQLVEADVALYSPVPLRTWEDTVITQVRHHYIVNFGVLIIQLSNSLMCWHHWGF
jgi:hypothetical protein